jgi:hypothetical protein
LLIENTLGIEHIRQTTLFLRLPILTVFQRKWPPLPCITAGDERRAPDKAMIIITLCPASMHTAAYGPSLRHPQLGLPMQGG